MFRSLNDKAYVVGGKIRDEILELESNDCDYCIEATVEEFEKVFPDAKKVGQNFPVYLHPDSGEEIALTRTEKTGNVKQSNLVDIGSYQDFEVIDVGVSIYHDLARRDFTINSIAKNYLTGEIVDPYNGIFDIEHKILRCINNMAFVEDPLRIYRGARFAARFGLTIESFTLQSMKNAGFRLRNITMERVALELEKVYDQCDKPSEFFRILDKANLLNYHFIEFKMAQLRLAGKPEWHPEGSVFNHLMDAFDRAKESGYSFPVAMAALTHDLGKLGTPEEELPSHRKHEARIEILEGFLNRHRFSNEVSDLCKVVFTNHMRVHDLERIKKPVKIVRFVKAMREKFRVDFINACDCDDRLSNNQFFIWNSGVEAVKKTKIVIPEASTEKSDIIAYVEQQITKTYMDIINEKI